MRRGFKAHKCCPWIAQTWIALAVLLSCIFFMAMLQLYGDALPDYDPVCQNITDLGFTIIPQLSETYIRLADIWILATVGVFLFILVPFVLDTPQLALRRFFFIMATLYLMRGLTVIDTRYPRLPFKGDKYMPTNPILGAFMVMIGAKSTQTDDLFSGHTCMWITIGSITSRYTRYGVISYFVWIANILGILALLGVREHYTADVIVAVIIAKLLFWVYHLFFDSMYRRFWTPGLELENTPKTDLVLPALLQDSAGNKIEINEMVVPRAAIRRGVYPPRRLLHFIPLDPVGAFREKFYKMLKWLDAE